MGFGILWKWRSAWKQLRNSSEIIQSKVFSTAAAPTVNRGSTSHSVPASEWISVHHLGLRYLAVFAYANFFRVVPAFAIPQEYGWNTEMPHV